MVGNNPQLGAHALRGDSVRGSIAPLWGRRGGSQLQRRNYVDVKLSWRLVYPDRATCLAARHHASENWRSRPLRATQGEYDNSVTAPFWRSLCRSSRRFPTLRIAERDPRPRDDPNERHAHEPHRRHEPRVPHEAQDDVKFRNTAIAAARPDCNAPLIDGFWRWSPATKTPESS